MLITWFNSFCFYGCVAFMFNFFFVLNCFWVVPLFRAVYSSMFLFFIFSVSLSCIYNILFMRKWNTANLYWYGWFDSLIKKIKTRIITIYNWMEIYLSVTYSSSNACYSFIAFVNCSCNSHLISYIFKALKNEVHIRILYARLQHTKVNEIISHLAVAIRCK